MGSACLCPSRTVAIGVYHHIQQFLWVLGIQGQVFVLNSKELTNYAISSALHLNFFFKFILRILHAYMPVYHFCASTHRGQKRMLDILELELQVVVSHLVAGEMTQQSIVIVALAEN